MIQEIKFGPMYRGRDVHQTPEGRSYNITNMYRTKDGALRKRPGYSEFKDFGATRRIMKVWAPEFLDTGAGGDGVFVVRNGAGAQAILDWLKKDASVTNIINATSAELLNDIVPSTLCLKADRNMIAAGGDILDLTNPPNTPATVTVLTNAPASTMQPYGLAFARGYLFCTSVLDQSTYFNNNASMNYNVAADWRSYENNRKPDGYVSVFNVNDEIANLSIRSCEFAWLDGVAPWAEIDRSYIPFGHEQLRVAIAQVSNDIYFMSRIGNSTGENNVWRFVRIRSSDYQLQDISNGIEMVITPIYQGLSAGEFGIAPISAGTPNSLSAGTFSLQDGNQLFIVSDHASANDITLVYDASHEEWYRWGKGSTPTHWPLHSFTMPSWESFASGTDGPYTLAADTGTLGLIFSIDKSIKNDNATAIQCELETGQLTRGTMRQKRVSAVRVYAKRVSGGSFTMYINDENLGYDAGETISLDPTGGEYVMCEVRNVGVYRSRQYKFVHSSASDDFVIVRVEEDFDILDR